MKTKNRTSQSTNLYPFTKPALLGALIAFALIALFLFPIQDPNPEWGSYWMFKPILLVTLAGAIGGIFFYCIRKYGPQKGWQKIVVVFAGILIYIIGLWIATVLGLDGTLWD